jgi:hypothetical protein
MQMASFKENLPSYKYYLSLCIDKFLTKRTTCASEMLKKTTCQKICQKGPRLGGGTSGQATCVACRLGQFRHRHAATPNTGRSPDGRRR